MMILADFYLAFAVLLVAAAGGLALWHLWAQPAHSSRLKVAAILLAISGMITLACMAHYGTHLMDQGECPYAESLLPCPTTPGSDATRQYEKELPTGTRLQRPVPRKDPLARGNGHLALCVPVPA